MMKTMKERSERYDRKLFWRDVREIGAAVLVAAFYGHEAATAGEPLARAGALVVVAGAALVVWMLLRARRSTASDAGASRAERVRAEIGKIDAQIRLLETVHRWYLAPLVVGLTLMTAAGGIAGWPEVLTLGVVYGGSVLVWHLNRRAADSGLRPHRRDLALALDRIEGSNDGEAADATH